MSSLRTLTCTMYLGIALSGCSQETAPPSPTTASAPAPPPPAAAPQPTPAPQIDRVQATPVAIEQARADLQRLADRDRRTKAALPFEEFEATVFKERFEGGKYIVNGDTPIANRKLLREFYDQNVKPQQSPRLVLHQVGGLDAKWNDQQKQKLSYCVSTTFGAQQAEVIQQMAAATGEWEKVSAVDFVHDTSQDATCAASNTTVVFDVRPVNVDGEYLARAFFPNEPRGDRNVLIDESSFGLPPNEHLQLVGILRHELGHTLGFRHEHTRPQSGRCFEDNDWRPLTAYDAFSVMHYPQCNGRGDWSLTLTDRDKNATACLYGAAPGFTIDTTLVTVTCATAPPASTPGTPKTDSFTGQTVAKGAARPYGPFRVTPNTPLEIDMGGATASGDPDLYIRFAGAPTVSQYDCRPYTEGAVERCSVTVPSDASRVFVVVRGYALGAYDLRVTRVEPGGTGGGQ